MTTVDDLREQVRGPVLTKGDARYEEAREGIHNGMFRSREPQVVIQVANVGDVVLDFSQRRSVWVDPEQRRARADAGATWGDFNAAVRCRRPGRRSACAGRA